MNKLHEPDHKLWNMSQLAFWLFHIEALSKAQITQDVEHKIRHLISHVYELGPYITLFLSLFEQAEPSIDVGVDEYFSSS